MVYNRGVTFSRHTEEKEIMITIFHCEGTMNIFFLDRDPAIAARHHCNKHVVKMIVESAQLLSTAHRILDGEKNDKQWILPDERDQVLYRATHPNHPSAVWVRDNIDHYRWVHDLLYYLIYEYKLRYGGKYHKTQGIQLHLLDAPKNTPITEWQDPPQCMPDECKHEDTVTAYRNYYTKYKSDIAKWTVREEPEWWNETLQRIRG